MAETVCGCGHPKTEFCPDERMEYARAALAAKGLAMAETLRERVEREMRNAFISLDDSVEVIAVRDAVDVALKYAERAEAAEKAMETQEAAHAKTETYWYGEAKRLEKALAEMRRISGALLNAPIWGHGHWDRTMQHGRGCETCIAQHEARKAFSDAYAAMGCAPREDEGGHDDRR